ncbi:hypothetical protein D6850_07890 [Roseovarius spongiae]|uniref:Translesion DNA synthesis-associated protein ImuA n=1 Tax=Roseovarius spongiae TaxID=2320272 RepID=A0A3A8ATA8_9RHOB|nr:hypothetical protein [Roseovarius spongiae]RKF14789.1 hypothetical protein D6850_07890 [Roseovarius spongiae]
MADETAPPALAPARVHEAEGPGRRAFALWQAARHDGPLIWVLPTHAAHLPMLRGLPEGVGARLHILRPANELDLLWSVEECLRSPGVALVIAEPEKPLSLIAGRRLQLAAEAGRTSGLMLIREDQGSNAAETRWRCAPIAGDGGDSTLHRWELKKNKKGTLGTWTTNWNGKTTALHLVCATGERNQPAQAPR